MPSLTVTELTPEHFTPYGEVFKPGEVTARIDHVARIENRRPGARPNQFLARSGVVALPHRFTRMEQHPHSNQSFVPMAKRPVLIAVALPGPDGLPDLSTLRGFLGRGQGFNYRAGIWHIGVASLGEAVPVVGFMFEDGTPEDCVFAEVPACELRAG
jgi:ureidoglycolate lyase